MAFQRVDDNSLERLDYRKYLAKHVADDLEMLR